MPADDDAFDPDRILATLDAHRVNHVLVGGFAARAHGATRPTADIGCVPDSDDDNYERPAAALRELGARLRIGGMSDTEARRLPVVIDARTLRSFGNSTWMTDAGPLDLLVELRDGDGGRHSYADLATRAVPHDVGASLCDSPRSTTSSPRSSSPTGKDNEALPELRKLQRTIGRQRGARES